MPTWAAARDVRASALAPLLLMGSYYTVNKPLRWSAAMVTGCTGESARGQRPHSSEILQALAGSIQ